MIRTVYIQASTMAGSRWSRWGKCSCRYSLVLCMSTSTKSLCWSLASGSISLQISGSTHAPLGPNCNNNQATKPVSTLLACYVTALFNDMRTLANSKVSFFNAVNHFSGPLGKQKFTSTGSKGHIHGLWLVDVWSIFCFSQSWLSS